MKSNLNVQHMDGLKRPIELISMRIQERLLADNLHSDDIIPLEVVPSRAWDTQNMGLHQSLQVLSILNLLTGRTDGTLVLGGSDEINVSPLSFRLGSNFESPAQLVETLILLECKCASVAIHRASEQDWMSVHSAFLGMESATYSLGIKKFLMNYMAFHLGVGRAAHNKVLYQMLRVLEDIIVVWVGRSLQFNIKKTMRSILNQSRDIYEALITSNEKDAKYFIAKHIEKFTKVIYNR
ncbi:FCD domain-containing protein [Alicyclobacillus tolerans]|uniref:FadR/GntR family transcriptional regulator n=1 Tax=Alicyclobacillus tolerans TaxID=90970 RepID=UPI001F208100|nr:FCD domain-containing protein [Alicyclobacillus tolerans]MCF8565147.1 FCD domain-containing protein [Alicyclobacillus tolerans]